MEHCSWHWSKAFKLYLSWKRKRKTTDGYISIKLMHSYLTRKKEGTDIGTTYSSLRDIIFSVPQGSVSGP